MEQSRDLEGHTYNRWFFILVLLFGSFTMSISQSSVSNIYRPLMDTFNVQMTSVQWMTTGFMLVMCIMMPVSPWLLNNVKFKNLFMSILLTFDIGTLIIIFAHSFITLIIGRALEAIAVGILFPSFQSVLLYITPKAKRGTVMGLAGLVMGSALALGPTICSVILNFTAWRGLFMFFMVVVTVLFILALFAIKDVMPHKESHLDFISVILSIGLIGILYFVNAIGQLSKGGGSLSFLLLILVVSLIMVTAFVYRQFHLKEPLLQLRVMKNLNFDLSMGLTGISYIALIVVTIIYPQYYQTVLGIPAKYSGFALIPGSIIMSVLNPLTGHLADKFGFKRIMVIGMSMILLGWLALTIMPFQFGLIAMIITSSLIKGGNAFVMMPATTLGGDSLPKEYISHGTAVITTVRQILGSTGVMIASLILTNVTNDSLGRGIRMSLARNNGYHVVFLTFFIIEIFGMIMALMIKNNHKEGAKK
ncbi:MFS transporter [Philodulcilactobacillus myokoensis]|uniref:MFS transporter n=1 Tax=Philodulcilactobacillus myokoensis TaxID=2929573 RepID=A0A9W6B040_9LACO|nr:MFS transporter [Philodulcilactobacillus myokoensis]GLB46517.1 MFS transporter [Philodulcilactobacillus myokoensis]